MVFTKIPVSHVKKYIPSRRSVLCASTVVAILAGPIGLATANAVSSSPAAASTSTSTPTTTARTAAATPSSAGKPAAKAAAAKPAAKPPTSAPAPAHNAAPAAKPAAAVAVAAARPADPYAGVTIGRLEPAGLYGYQEHFTASSEQLQNAKTIVQVAKQRGMSPYAAVIAVAVAMQESSLRNLATAVDADSLGLFQQRPSMGWGSPSELTNPAYATGAFLSALTHYAPGYDSMPLWQAAQDTQRSGYPTAYARWEDQAAHLVQQITTG